MRTYLHNTGEATRLYPVAHNVDPRARKSCMCLFSCFTLSYAVHRRVDVRVFTCLETFTFYSRIHIKVDAYSSTCVMNVVSFATYIGKQKCIEKHYVRE